MRRWVKYLAAATAMAVLIAVVVSWLAPGVLYRAAMGLERRLAGLQVRQIDVQGQRWALLDGGKRDGRPLVLLHGFGADKDNWLRVARLLKGDFHLIVPDLPGFGDSPLPADGDNSIESQATRVAGLLDALGLEGVNLGGSSMGGYLALALARQRPEQVRSLWLLAPGGVSGAPSSEMMDLIAAGRGNPLIPREPADFDRTLDIVFEHQPFIPLPVRRYLARRQAARYVAYEAIFADLRYRSAPAEELAAGLRLPALIVWGEKDRVLHPAGAAALTRIMPQASVRLMPGVGHLPMVEVPKETAQAFLAWQRQLENPMIRLPNGTDSGSVRRGR